jgi:hypothetical protein
MLRRYAGDELQRELRGRVKPYVEVRWLCLKLGQPAFPNSMAGVSNTARSAHPGGFCFVNHARPAFGECYRSGAPRLGMPSQYKYRERSGTTNANYYLCGPGFLSLFRGRLS